MELYFSPIVIVPPRPTFSRAGVARRNDPRSPLPPVKVIGMVRDWRRRAYERHLLAQFGEHERRDLGLTPADVAGECAKPFWRA